MPSNPEDEEITLGSFKTKSPHRNPNLYVTIGSAVAIWNETGNALAAVAVVVAFLVSEGYVRAKAVEAAGVFATSLGPIQIENLSGYEGHAGPFVEFQPGFEPGGDE
jgi:hypothetical protein